MLFKSFLPLFAVLGQYPTSAASAALDHEEIICHGKDCYPRMFQATEEFQIIREDQMIPKGLHVRMDFHTGLKEAKLYDGNDDDDASLRAVEVFEEYISTDSTPTPSLAENLGVLQYSDQKVFKPGKVDQGAIRPPLTGSDGTVFSRDTKTIIASASTDSEALLPALETLEDLSHDIYWGLQLGQDSKIIHKLNTLIQTPQLNVQISSAAALLLGTAIQNNPAALKAAISHFYNDEYPTGPLETILFALINEQIPALSIRLVYLLSALCQDQTQLLAFLRNDGLSILRTLYDTTNTNQTTLDDRLKQKISNFILDHFLQNDSLQHLSISETAKPSVHLGTPPPAEEPWIIIDYSQIPSASAAATKTPPRTFNLRSELVKWCKPFSDSLKVWEKSSRSNNSAAGGGESQVARDHVLEASEALEERLRGWGCSCDEDWRCL